MPGFSHFCVSVGDVTVQGALVVLSSVPKRKKAGMCLMQQVQVLDKLPSGPSYTALLAMSPMRTDQQCVLIVSLQKDT